MNFIRRLSTQIAKKNKINLDSDFYNFMLSQNSKDTIKFFNGDYTITDSIGDYHRNIKKGQINKNSFICHFPSLPIEIRKKLIINYIQS